MFVAYMRTVRKPSKCPVMQKLGNSSILYGKTKNSFELRIGEMKVFLGLNFSDV